jgi:hypothetical protein
MLFTATVDDGARLWIDDILTLDDWGVSNELHAIPKIVYLAAGQHTVRLEYREHTGRAAAKLTYEVLGPVIPDDLMPTDSLNQNLLASWSFEKSADDTSGYSLHATPVRAVNYDAGAIGNYALHLVGTDAANGSYVQLPEMNFGSMESFSINTWISESSLANYEGEGYVTYGSDTQGWFGIAHRFCDNQDVITMNIGQKGCGALRIPFRSSDRNNFVMYTLVSDGKTLRGYRNGVLVGEKLSGATALGYQPGWIGAHQDADGFSTRLNGWVDATRLYDRALSASDIALLYQQNPQGVIEKVLDYVASAVPVVEAKIGYDPRARVFENATIDPGIYTETEIVFKGTNTILGDVTFHADNILILPGAKIVTAGKCTQAEVVFDGNLINQGEIRFLGDCPARITALKSITNEGILEAPTIRLLGTEPRYFITTIPLTVTTIEGPATPFMYQGEIRTTREPITNGWTPRINIAVPKIDIFVTSEPP